MNRQIPIITKVEFFDTSYEPMRANVSARNFSSLTYRKRGKVFISSGNTEFVSESDTLTFMPAGCNYSTEILEGGEMIILHYQIFDKSEDFFDKPTLIRPIDKNRFSDLFSRIVGCRFVEYLTSMRLNRARAMLRNTDRPIGDVAAACGFGTVSNFTRAFRRVYGKAPSSYRREGGSDKK